MDGTQLITRRNLLALPLLAIAKPKQQGPLFFESRTFEIREICRIFAVPMELVCDQAATFANLDREQKRYWRELA